MSATFKIRQAGDVTVVDLAGRIVFGEASSALRVVQDLIQNNRKKILLNPADLSYIDSAYICDLVASYTSVTNRGGQLRLLNPTKRVTDLLHSTKLDTVCDIGQYEAHALRSFAFLAANA